MGHICPIYGSQLKFTEKHFLLDPSIDARFGSKYTYIEFTILYILQDGKKATQFWKIMIFKIN